MARRTLIQIAETRSISHKAASLCQFPKPGHVRQTILDRQLCNLDAPSGKLGVIGHHDSVRASYRDKYAFKIRRIALDLDLKIHA